MKTPHHHHSPTRFARPVLAVVGLALATQACGADAPSSDQGTAAVTRPDAKVSLEHFWAGMAATHAEYGEHFASLDELRSSDAIAIKGRITSVGPGRRMQGDVEIDKFQLGQMTVVVEEVLLGTLPVVRPDDTIILETLTIPTEAPTESSMVLFLRWGPDAGSVDPQQVLARSPELRERYALPSNQSVWIDTPRGAANPFMEAEGVNPATDELGALLQGRPMSEVYALLRAANGRGAPTTTVPAAAPTTTVPATAPSKATG